MTTNLPPTASFATTVEGDKLNAPSAERNADALTDLLCRIAPATGAALEIASGTGQHIIRFAAALPKLHWTPSDIAHDRLASIKAYRDEAALTNVNDPVSLDACAPGWSAVTPAQDLILTANILHLISDTAARTLVTEAAKTLARGGILMLYGPYLRNGQTTSDGDASFHAKLQGADPDIGYKDRDQVIGWAQGAGLDHADTVPMPANNLALIFTSP